MAQKVSSEKNATWFDTLQSDAIKKISCLKAYNDDFSQTSRTQMRRM